MSTGQREFLNVQLTRSNNVVVTALRRAYCGEPNPHSFQSFSQPHIPEVALSDSGNPS